MADTAKRSEDRSWERDQITDAIAKAARPAEPEPLVITVPMPINISNGGHYHWRTTYKQKTAYINALDMRQIARLIPRPPAVPFPRARISAVMHLANRMDADNAMRRCKWPLDWLKTRGYIADDSPKVLDWAGFPEQVVKRDGDYRITFTLTPLS